MEKKCYDKPTYSPLSYNRYGNLKKGEYKAIYGGK